MRWLRWVISQTLISGFDAALLVSVDVWVQSPDDFAVFRSAGGLSSVILALQHVQDVFEKLSDRLDGPHDDRELIIHQQRRITYVALTFYV